MPKNGITCEACGEQAEELTRGRCRKCYELIRRVGRAHGCSMTQLARLGLVGPAARPGRKPKPLSRHVAEVIQQAQNQRSKR